MIESRSNSVNRFSCFTTVLLLQFSPWQIFSDKVTVAEFASAPKIADKAEEGSPVRKHRGFRMLVDTEARSCPSQT